jgi:hypothetical protein
LQHKYCVSAIWRSEIKTFLIATWTVSCLFGFKFGVGYLLCRCYWTCWLIIGNWRYCSMTVWSVTYRISVSCSSNLSLVMPRTCPLLSPSQVWSLSPWIMIYKICVSVCWHCLVHAFFHFIPFIQSGYDTWLAYRLQHCTHTHTHLIHSIYPQVTVAIRCWISRVNIMNISPVMRVSHKCTCYSKSVRNTVQWVSYII